MTKIEAEKLLKPCPFCGDTPEVVLHRDGYFRLFHRCSVVGCIVLDGGPDPRSLVESWNTRKARR